MLSVQVLTPEKTIRQGTIDDIEKRESTWLDVTKPTKQELEVLSKITEIPVSDFEESLHQNQRPELRDTAHYSMITLRFTHLKNVEMETKPVVILVSKERKDFITLHRHDSLAIKRMFNYSDAKKTALFEQGATELLFALISEKIASYYTVLNNTEMRIAKLEALIFRPNGDNGESIMREILRIKKTLIYFYQSLTGNREILSSIEQAFATFLDNKKVPRFRLLASDITQLIELTSTERDILTTTLEVHLSVISNSLNQTMKKVTSWGALILVPSLIAGIYGMNFKHLPWAEWAWGFPALLIVMAVLMGLLLKYFKRNDWI